ncbi:hypothetical protein H9623_13130 [Oerskovia sp. Sa1BUA8]|uniref:Uncharacterized protein n=1 Tax=Oerskovia douganii TaxID=2762210 RepID=A0A9D5U9Y5_9CELL|nr:hypothetical protein [Oerskovia douganii]MBE7701239.1 hypothetical protein [Oerskovia douganii]
MTRIDTVDQLNALPIGSVIRLGSGQVFVRVDLEGRWDWQTPGCADYWGSAHVLAEHDGPHALLHVPGRDLVQEAQANAWDEGKRAGRADVLSRQRANTTPNPYRDEAPRQG